MNRADEELYKKNSKLEGISRENHAKNKAFHPADLAEMRAHGGAQ